MNPGANVVRCWTLITIGMFFFTNSVMADDEKWRAGIGYDISQNLVSPGTPLPRTSGQTAAIAVPLPDTCLKPNAFKKLNWVELDTFADFEPALQEVLFKSGFFSLSCPNKKIRLIPVLELYSPENGWFVWDTASRQERSDVIKRVIKSWDEFDDHSLYRDAPSGFGARIYGKDDNFLEASMVSHNGSLLLAFNTRSDMQQQAVTKAAEADGYNASVFENSDFEYPVLITVGSSDAATIFKSLATTKTLMPKLRLVALNIEAEEFRNRLLE